MKGRNLLSTTKVDDNQHTTTNRDDSLVEWPLLGADLEKNGGMGVKNDANENNGNGKMTDTTRPSDTRTGKVYSESVETVGTGESTFKGEEVIIDCSDEDEKGSDVKENEDGYKTSAYENDNSACQGSHRGELADRQVKTEHKKNHGFRNISIVNGNLKTTAVPGVNGVKTEEQDNDEPETGNETNNKNNNNNNEESKKKLVNDKQDDDIKTSITMDTEELPYEGEGFDTRTNDPYRTEEGELKKNCWADYNDEIEDEEEVEKKKRDTEKEEESDNNEDEDDYGTGRKQDNQNMEKEKETEAGNIQQEREAENDGNVDNTHPFGKKEVEVTDIDMSVEDHGSEQQSAGVKEELAMNSTTKGMDMDMDMTNNEDSERPNNGTSEFDGTTGENAPEATDTDMVDVNGKEKGLAIGTAEQERKITTKGKDTDTKNISVDEALEIGGKKGKTNKKNADSKITVEKSQDGERNEARLLHDIHKRTAGFVDVHKYDPNNAVKAIKIEFAVDLDFAKVRELQNTLKTPDGDGKSVQHPFVIGIHKFIKMAKTFHGDEVTFTTSRTRKVIDTDFLSARLSANTFKEHFAYDVTNRKGRNVQITMYVHLHSVRSVYNLKSPMFSDLQKENIFLQPHTGDISQVARHCIGWNDKLDPESTHRDEAERSVNISMTAFCLDPKNKEFLNEKFRQHTKHWDWDGKVIPKLNITIEYPWQGQGEQRLRTKALGYRVATEYQTVASTILMKMTDVPFVPTAFALPHPATYRAHIIGYNMLKASLDRVEINRLTRPEMDRIKDDILALKGVHQVDGTAVTDRIGKYVISFKKSMAETTLKAIESIISQGTRDLERPWHQPPRLAVKEFQSAPSEFVAKFTKSAQPFMQLPNNGLTWSNRVTNSRATGIETTENPKGDNTAFRKLISDEVTKQCNNKTLQNTKTMLHNTAVVDELKVEIKKLKSKSQNLQDQLDETNGLKTRIEEVERKVTSHGEELENQIKDIAVVGQVIEKLAADTDVNFNGMGIMVAEVQSRQTTLADEVAGRMSNEAQIRDNIRDAALRERDARSEKARERGEATTTQMMERMMAMMQTSVAQSYQEQTPTTMTNSGNSNKRRLRDMEEGIVSPNVLNFRPEETKEDDFVEQDEDNPQL